VWGNGRAALKCTATNCEWEMSAQDYADRMRRMERGEKGRNEYLDEDSYDE